MCLKKSGEISWEEELQNLMRALMLMTKVGQKNWALDKLEDKDVDDNCSNNKAFQAMYPWHI